jgi:predicted HicB family RNase H-like nuclease
MIEHKGYIAEVVYDDSVDLLHARVANSGDCPIATAEASDVASLKHEFAVSVDVYLAWCEEDGVEPVKPQAATKTAI